MALDVNLNKELLTSLNKLITGLEKLDQTIKDTNKVAERLETAFSPTIFNDFLKALNKLDDQGKDAFRTLTRGMADVIQEVGRLDVVAVRAIPALNRLIKTMTGGSLKNSALPGKVTVSNLIELIRQLITGLDSIQGINTSSLKSIRALADTLSAFTALLSKKDLSFKNLTGFKDSITDIAEIIVKINALPEFDKASLNKARILRDFINAFIQVERSDFGVSQRLIQNIDGIFKVFTILEKIDSVNINEQALAKLSGLTRILRTIAASIEIFANDLKNVNTGQIARKLTSITAITTLIASISQKLPGTASLDNFSKVFQRIGIAFANLARAFNQTDSNPGLNASVQRKIQGALIRLAATLKLIGVLARFREGGSVQVFADVLSRLATALNNLRKLNLDDAGKINTKAINRGITELVKVVKTLRTLRGVQLPDLDAPLKAIAEFISAFNNIDIENQRGKSRAFKSFISDLEDAFKKLSRFGTVALPNLTPLTNGFKQFNEEAELNGIDVGVTNLREAKPVFADLLNIVEVFKLTIQGIKFVNLEGQLRRVASAAIEVGNNIRNAGNDLREFGQNVIQNFGLQNIFGSSAFTSAVDFDKLSTQLKVFGNLTDDELKSAQAFANQIGIDYPLSANEALEATLDLNKAGLGLAETFTTLPAAADLAALSETGSLETATQTIIGATKTFKEFADGVPASFANAATAATLFAGAADASTASTESLNEGLANIGATAPQFGLNLADTLSILAALDDAQIKGAEGGTALRSALVQLNSAAGQKELQRLGVSLTDAEGNFRDLDAVFKDLNEALNGTVTVTTTVNNLTADQTKTLNNAQKAYSEAQGKVALYNDQLEAGVIDQDTYTKKVEDQQEVLNRTSGVITEITGSITETNRITSELTRSQQDNAKSAKALFGAYGLAAGSILIANNGFDDYRKKVLEAEAANIRAQKLLDNLAGDFEQLRGSVETLVTKAFLPLINRALRPIIKLGRTFVDFFLALPQPILDIATNTILLVSAFATLIGIGSVVVGVVVSFGGALLTAVGTITALIVNGPLLIAAVGGFIASFAGLVVVLSAVSAVFIGLSTLITNVFQAVETNAGGAGTAFKAVQSAVQGLFNTVRFLLSKFGGVFQAVFGGDSDPEAFGRIVAGVFRSIENSIKSVTGAVYQFTLAFDFKRFTGSLKLLKSGFSQISAAFKAAFSGEGDPSTILNAAFGTIAASFTDIFSQLTGLNLSNIWGTFLTKGFSAGLQEAASGILSAFRNFFLENEEGITNAIVGIFNFILPGSGLARLLEILGLNDLANAIRSVLEPIQNIFRSVLGTLFDVLKGQNLEEAILGNFGTAGKSIVNVAKAIGKAFASFATIIETLVSALFPPGTNISGGSIIEVVFKGIETAFLALDAFVLKPLSKILPSIIGVISSGFNGILSVAGQVLGFIRQVSQPLTNLFEQLFSGGIDLQGFFERLPQALSTIFQTLISQIPTVLANLGTFITDAFIGLGELIGSPFLVQLGEQLKTGDFQAVLTTVATEFINLVGRVVSEIPKIATTIWDKLGELIGSPFLTNLKDQIVSFNFGALITEAANGFLTLISSIVNAIPPLIGTGLGNLGELIGSPFLTKLGNDITSFQFGAALNTVAQAIVKVITDAVALVPDLFVTLGDTFGIPFFTKLGEALDVGSLGDVINTVANAIADVIEAALGLVPDLLTSLGTLLQIQPLIDLGNLLESPFLAQLSTVFANLVALPLNIIGDAVNSVQQLLTELQNNPEAVARFQQLVVAFGAFISIIALSNFSTIAFTVGRALGVILANVQALGSAAIKFAGFVAVLLVLKNALQLLSDLVGGGNFFQNLGDFFINLGSDVANLFGLDVNAEQLSNTLKQLLAVITLGFERFVRDLSNKFNIAIQNIKDAAANAGDDLAARLGTLGARQSEVYFALGERLGQDGGTELFKGLGFELTKAAEQNEPGITELILRQLRVNFTKIVDEFRGIVPQLATVDDETFRAIANTIIGAGALEDAFRIVAEQEGPAGLNAFVQRLIADAPTALAGANVDDLGFILIDSITSGLITDANAVGLLDALVTAGTITPEKRAELQKQIKEAIGRELELINTALQTGDGTTPIEVPVKPTVEGTDGETPTWVDDLATEVQGLTTGQDIPVTVTPTVADDAGTTIEAELAEQTPPEIPTNIDVGDPQSIEDGTQALLDLQNQTVLTEGALVTFQAQTSAVTLAINESSLAIQAYGVVSGLVIGGVSLAWLGYSGIVKLVSDNIVNNIENVKIKLFEFADALLPKFEILRGVVQDIGTALLALPEGLPIIPGSGDGGGSTLTDGGPRALGGSVAPKKFYEVFDTSSPELLEHGGKFYLLPNASGRVTPMQSVPQLAGATAGGGSMNIQINAPITIDVSNLPSGVTAADVAQIVGQRVDSAFRETQNTLIRRLRRAGAQGIDG